MNILIVEDDRKAARLLARGLQEEGFAPVVAASAEEGAQCLGEAAFDLIVLDWMLPGGDGLTLCRQLRARRVATPILILTARDALTDRVDGLNSGADDYLTKPFAFEELLARVRALLRRPPLGRTTELALGDLRLDLVSRRATRGEAVLLLTAKEFALLEFLVRHAGEVVSRAQLAGELWRTDLIGIDNLIDAHIRNLRRKLDLPELPPLIHTVRGQGFRLEAIDA